MNSVICFSLLVFKHPILHPHIYVTYDQLYFSLVPYVALNLAPSLMLFGGFVITLNLVICNDSKHPQAADGSVTFTLACPGFDRFLSISMARFFFHLSGTE